MPSASRPTEPEVSPEVVHGLASTIVPVLNRPIMLRQAADSVLTQTYRPIEIIIVDDGSTDETAHTADQIAEAHPDEVRVLHISNRGPGLAREAGRQAARGEFIQYLDSDDLLRPRKFEVQVAALRARPECGIAYGYTRLVSADGEILAAPYKWTGRDMGCLFPALLVDRWWNTHTPLWRRSVTDAVGPWRDMRMGEDWEYDARAGALRTVLAHCPEFLSDTRQHPTDRLTGGRMNRDMMRDISALILSLDDCAVRAGVSADCPEMRHFSRWAFLVARQAGAVGLAAEARQAFEAARRTAGHARRRAADLRVYAAAAKCLGWSLAGRLSCMLDGALKRKPSPATLASAGAEHPNS